MSKRRTVPNRRPQPAAQPAPEDVPAALPQAPEGRRGLLRRALHHEVALLSGLVLLFGIYYFWTAAPCSSWHVDCSPTRVRAKSGEIIGPYNVLASSFLAGQVSLLYAPDPQLLRLPDPYDPRQNFYYKLHDMSLYNGKYYLYFGPAPALFLFAPFQLLTNAFLPDAFGCAFLALGAYVAACLSLRLFLKTFFPTLPAWVLPVLSFGLGFCNTFPFLLRRPAMYEIAIAGGQFFLMMAVLLLGRAALGASRRPWLEASLGGAMAALAFASRPQLLVAEGGLFLMLFIAPPAGKRWKLLTAALAPLFAGGLIMAWYNYVRFNSPFEFGEHYVLAGTNMAHITVFETSRVLTSLYFYFLCPPKLSSLFPFVRVEPHAPFRLPASYIGLEGIVGVVWLSPLVLVLALAPWLWRRGSKDTRPCVWVLLFLTSAVTVLSVNGMLGATMRYLADSSSLLFLAASLVAAKLLVTVPPQLGPLVRWVLAALILFGITCNAAIGITGYYDNFRKSDPEQYRVIESLFQPLSHALAALGVRPGTPK